MKKKKKDCKIKPILGWATVVFATLSVIGIASEGLGFDLPTLALLGLMGADSYYLIKK